MPASAYLVVLVADDPLDADGNPLRDARGDSPGRGVLLLRAHVFGSWGARRVIEAVVSRHFESSDEGGYAAQRGKPVVRDRPTGPVGTPGGALGQAELPAVEGVER
jgi:hypothetical protein